jgi:electron transport complex protein RnfC
MPVLRGNDLSKDRMDDVEVQSKGFAAGTIPGFASLPLASTLLVPLTNGLAPMEPGEVRQGKVRRGEALSGSNLASGFTPVAPASGTIVGVREIELTTGKHAPAVEIAVDAEQPEVTVEDQPAFDGKLSDVLERLASGGVWADRNTTPDLMAQLQAALKRPIETVICNLLEADGAPLNAAIVRSGAAQVVAGALSLAKALAARVQFVVDAGEYPAMSAAIRQAKASYARMVELPNDYPQADPTILIYMLTGRRLRPGRLPVEQGVLMLDGPAALAVGQSIEESRPMLEVPLVVRERGCGRVHLVSAAVGTPVRHVLEMLRVSTQGIVVRAGAVLRELSVGLDAIVAGGEMRLDVGPVTIPANPDPCIRCGWCVAACPTRIHPAGLLEAAQQHDEEMAETYGIHACIECGICSYVCPSRLPLLGAIRGLGRGMHR